MIRCIALALCDLAAVTLPPGRREWGDAMKAELHFAEDPAAALIHAGGCMLAAIRARAALFETRFAIGLWSLAAITVASAFLHIACAARGVHVLLGAPDGFLAAMQRSGRTDPMVIARYESARPIVIGCFFSLGLAHLLAARYLVRRAFDRFLIVFAATMAIATLAVAIQLSIVWTADGLPSEFHALLVQTIALPILLAWSNGRHRQRTLP